MLTTVNWGGGRFELKRQFFKLIGSNFRIYDASGNLVLFSHQKGFKLKEDIRVYHDEGGTREALSIQARQVFDFAGAYDVIDVQTREKVGAFKRKGWQSMIRDEWIVMDANDREIAKVLEDSQLLALLRRFLTNLVPQNYDMLLTDGSRVADYKQHFNPFVYWLSMDFTMDPQNRIDPRLKVAAGVLLAAIEGRQEG
jgi:uncharacterized protein YxjI